MQGPNYYLYFIDPNNYSNSTFTLVSGPTNGILEYRTDLCNGQWLRVPLNIPLSNNTVRYPAWNQCSTFNNCKWSYTSTNSLMSSTGSMDTFTWRMSNNDGPSTNYFSGASVATCSIYVNSNQVPVAQDIYRSCAPDTGTTFAVNFTDGDAREWNSSNLCGQSWSVIIVTPPTNGVFTATNGLFLTYRPNPGTLHQFDHFTFKVNDAKDPSNIANGTIQIRNTRDRSGNLVVLIVDTNLLQGTITNAIYRLKNDLEHDGYTAKITGWSNPNSSNLWAYLVSEYTATNQFLSGAILVGGQPGTVPPLAYVTNGPFAECTDLVYWNLTYFQRGQVNNAPRNIWVSRFLVPDSTYGNTTNLLQRALDANHDYRTGTSRLPHKAFCYTSVSKNYGEAESNALARMQEVWPEADGRGAPGFAGVGDPNFHFLTNRVDLAVNLGGDCLAAGGEMFEESSDGVPSGCLYFDTCFLVPDVYRIVNQMRFVILNSCDCATPSGGGLANNMLTTRGGGCVLAMGATATFGGGFLMSESSFIDRNFRKLLKDGEAIGTAAVEYYAFTDSVDDRTMFYGDLSLSVMAAPSNRLPVIRNFISSISASHSPARVSCSVDAYDPDGAISNIEWFLTGYDYGRAQPTLSGAATSIVWSCATPGVYTTRVEVIDNYKARSWSESVITVMAPTACTVSASAGAGGSIAPSGSVVMLLGSSNSFINSPSQWFHTNSVLVDGLGVGAPGIVTLTNVMVDHTILAQFAPDLAISNTPKWWLYQQNTNWATNFDAAGLSDPDGDGVATWQEYIMGTDPTNKASVFWVRLAITNSQLVASWSSSVPDARCGGLCRYYMLEATTNLVTGPWLPAPGYTTNPASGQVMTYTGTPGTSALFFHGKTWLAP